MSRQPGLFDVDNRLKRPSDLGDYLEAFTAAVDFALIRLIPGGWHLLPS